MLHELRTNVGAHLAAAFEGRRRFLVPLPVPPGEVRHFVAERWLDCLEAGERSRAPAIIPWRALAIRLLPVTLTYFCYGWTLWMLLSWLPR